jgi:hypothetical protein
MAPLTCPAWCERTHPATGPQQVYVPHQADVAEITLIDGTLIEVVVSWLQRLDDIPSHDPELMVYTHTDDELAALNLSPGQAGMLAEVMSAASSGHATGALSSALAGDCDWLCNSLATAVVLLGYRDEGELEVTP